MKAPGFRYVRPPTVKAAVQALADTQDSAILAGGQSLLAMLNLRLAAPSLLVDIGGIAELRGIRPGDGFVEIGAGTTHCEVLDSPVIARHFPILVEALSYVAHPAVRNRGTMGGSLALADPAAEWPACMLALGGSLLIAGPSGMRELAADSFFLGMMQTALGQGEIIIAARIPIPGSVPRWGFYELARRHGDFALAGLAAVATAAATRLVYFGCTDHAHLAPNVSEALSGPDFPGEDAVDAALALDLSSFATAGCRAETHRRLARVVTMRVARQLRGEHK